MKITLRSLPITHLFLMQLGLQHNLILPLLETISSLSQSERRTQCLVTYLTEEHVCSLLLHNITTFVQNHVSVPCLRKTLLNVESWDVIIPYAV